MYLFILFKVRLHAQIAIKRSFKSRNVTAFKGTSAGHCWPLRKLLCPSVEQRFVRRKSTQSSLIWSREEFGSSYHFNFERRYQAIFRSFQGRYLKTIHADIIKIKWRSNQITLEYFTKYKIWRKKLS